MAQAQQFKIKELEAFTYKGVNRRGKKVDGEIKGTSIAEVKALLRQQAEVAAEAAKVAGRPSTDLSDLEQLAIRVHQAAIP